MLIFLRYEITCPPIEKILPVTLCRCFKAAIFTMNMLTENRLKYLIGSRLGWIFPASNEGWTLEKIDQ
jgi:hypothetical protein